MAQISNLPDEKIFESFRDIADKLSKLSIDIVYESAVYRAELNHRLSLGLTGDDAIKHYNDWMIGCGLPHLCVK